jgi:tetratricopeptide (TPR) repeat protein
VRRIEEQRDDVAIWIGRGDSQRAGATLDLLAQALRGALGIRTGEPLPERCDRIRARVAERVPAGDQKRVTEFLAELVGAPFPDDGDGGAALRAARQDAQLMSEQMRDAWLDFLAAETAAHPVLILLEDLHWGDFGTVRFIEMALRARRDRRWMVLALARPEVYEVFPKLWQRQSVQEIGLKGLGRKPSERLVRQVLGDRVGPETTERLVTQSAGNAFYLEELIRTVAEGKGGALPRTVLAMVETRLAQLPLQAKRVLRAASVFGEVCWESGVAALLGEAMEPAKVREWLARLVEQEVLTVQPEPRLSGERELVFRHALLREGAYSSLAEADRRLCHRLASEWLEQHGETDPMVLAGHFERGGEGARAAGYYLRAAQQSLHVRDLDTTIARTGLGLACAPPPELRFALLGVRCEAAAGSVRNITAALPDAEELLRSAPRGSIAWAQALLAYCNGMMRTCRIEELLAAIRLLHTVDPAPEAAERMAFALTVAICNLDYLGRLAEGTALEERLSALARATGERALIVHYWRDVAIGMRAAYAHEDPWSGFQHSAAIEAVFEEVGGQLMFMNRHLFEGVNLGYLGVFAPAERMLEAIAAADESMGAVSSLRRFSLSWLYANRGAFDEARSLATRLAEDGRARDNRVEEGRGRWALGDVLRRMGDLDGADRELAAACGLVIPLGQPGVLGSLAALRLAQGRPEEALAAAEDAVARIAAMGGCGMFRGALVRLAHAEALHATGAREAARRAIAEARARLLATAGAIADPDYRRRFLEDVSENARTLALAREWIGEPGPSV